MGKIMQAFRKLIPDSLVNSFTETCMTAFSMNGGSHAALHCASWGVNGFESPGRDETGTTESRYDFAAAANMTSASIADIVHRTEEFAHGLRSRTALKPTPVHVAEASNAIPDLSLQMDGLVSHDFYLS